MALVANFFSGIVRAIPVVLAKVGTFLLLVFTVGLFAGYLIAVMQLSLLFLVIPVVGMFVMWYKLDEGVLVLVLLSLAALFFPNVIESVLQGIF